ncbi:MAG: hypothetical protein AAF288_10355 [Planctomycetota bacterium]
MTRRVPRPGALALCGLAAWLSLFAFNATPPRALANTPSARATAGDGWVRGVTVSCRRNGPGEWDGPDMAPHLNRLTQGMGANWVAIHPYARVSADGSVRRRATDAATTVATQLAAERGVQMLIKPHLAYWGSPFDWRGEIDFGDDEPAWERFFGQYTQWIVHEARVAQAAGAGAFCVGLEYRKTLHREEDWRRVIAEVRKVFHGPLTYGAHWENVDRVPFWDALDVLGVCFYVPVAAGPNPTEQELRERWAELRRALASWSERHDGKPIVLAELGYARSVEAGKRPFSDRFVGPAEQAEALKALCLRVALEELRQEPSVVGVFLWKTFPRPTRVAGEFLIQGPALSQAVAQGWGAQAKEAGAAGAANTLMDQAESP